jgi:hypothetical protein
MINLIILFIALIITLGTAVIILMGHIDSKISESNKDINLRITTLENKIENKIDGWRKEMREDNREFLDFIREYNKKYKCKTG